MKTVAPSEIVEWGGRGKREGGRRFDSVPSIVQGLEEGAAGDQRLDD